MLMKVLAKELAPQSIRVNTIHPTTVATDMILNEPTYRLFRPDLASPTREDFEVAARTLNKLPVAALEPAHISNAILYLVSDAWPVRHRHHARRGRRRPALTGRLARGVAIKTPMTDHQGAWDMSAGLSGGTEADMLEGGYHFAALKGTTFMDPRSGPYIIGCTSWGYMTESTPNDFRRRNVSSLG